MPQFDFLTALAQFFTCFFGFIFFYFLILRFVLPSLASVLKFREKLFIAVSSSTNNKVKASRLITKLLERIYKK